MANQVAYAANANPLELFIPSNWRAVSARPDSAIASCTDDFAFIVFERIVYLRPRRCVKVPNCRCLSSPLAFIIPFFPSKRIFSYLLHTYYILT